MVFYSIFIQEKSELPFWKLNSLNVSIPVLEICCASKARSIWYLPHASGVGVLAVLGIPKDIDRSLNKNVIFVVSTRSIDTWIFGDVLNTWIFVVSIPCDLQLDRTTVFQNLLQPIFLRCQVRADIPIIGDENNVGIYKDHAMEPVCGVGEFPARRSWGSSRGQREIYIGNLLPDVHGNSLIRFCQWEIGGAWKERKLIRSFLAPQLWFDIEWFWNTWQANAD